MAVERNDDALTQLNAIQLELSKAIMRFWNRNDADGWPFVRSAYEQLGALLAEAR